LYKVPTIDSASDEGEKPIELIGNIEFNNVTFNYPSRPEITILKHVTYEIKPGSTVALVGSSGCGKSTSLHLIQRFYDPLEGVIRIDNRNLKDYNIKWLRTRIGVVTQEPVLFGTTIKENIKFGKDDATDDEIVWAAKNANAHDFIMTLPDVIFVIT
jgi:ABC-type multidrug transport system fused ATPase/permease subunit